MKKIPQLQINIRNKSEEQAVIDIDGEIGGIDWDTWESINTKKQIKAQLKEISDLKTKKIIVNISSLGGFVDDGLAIHDLLASHEAEIETNVTGMTASAATIIAQAGDVRKISDNALYLVHRAWGLAMGNTKDMEAQLSDMQAIDNKIANIYAKRSGKTSEEFLELMDKNNGDGIWIDGEEAIEYGLVDEVYEPMKAAAAVDPETLKNIGLPPISNNRKMTFDSAASAFATLTDSEGNLYLPTGTDGTAVTININDLTPVKFTNTIATAPIKEENNLYKTNNRKRKLNLLKNRVKWT